MSETISAHKMFSPGLSVEFSCIELVIQWTIDAKIRASDKDLPVAILNIFYIVCTTYNFSSGT